MTISHLIPNLSWLTNLAAKFTSNTAEAEDCAAIALERIEPRLADFQTEAQARAFLAKTARNAAIDAQRHAALVERGEKAWESLQDYPDDQIEAALRLRMIMDYGIPQLEPKRRAVAMLWAQGMDVAGIAKELGLSLKTVRNQKTFIIRDLKRWVKMCKL